MKIHCSCGDEKEKKNKPSVLGKGQKNVLDSKLKRILLTVRGVESLRKPYPDDQRPKAEQEKQSTFPYAFHTAVLILQYLAQISPGFTPF